MYVATPTHAHAANDTDHMHAMPFEHLTNPIWTPIGDLPSADETQSTQFPAVALLCMFASNRPAYSFDMLLHLVQSEYAPSCDERRHFISGFTGSAGTAVVTTDSAALWTDGRYFLQVHNSILVVQRLFAVC